MFPVWRTGIIRMIVPLDMVGEKDDSSTSGIGSTRGGTNGAGVFTRTRTGGSNIVLSSQPTRSRCSAPLGFDRATGARASPRR